MLGMRFPFNEKKAAQAAAYLTQLRGGRINYMALIKLLYYADRQSLVERGKPITGDRLVSMPHGPVLSRIYDRISTGNPPEHTAWYEYLTEPDHYMISLRSPEFETDELSRYEMKILEGIYRKYGHLTQWQLRDLSHRLPEWQDPQGSMIPIDPAEILRAAGHPPEEIERIAEEANEACFFESLDGR